MAARCGPGWWRGVLWSIWRRPVVQVGVVWLRVYGGGLDR